MIKRFSKYILINLLKLSIVLVPVCSIYAEYAHAEHADKYTFLISKANHPLNRNKLFSNKEMNQHFFDWEHLIHDNAGKSNIEKVKLVNDFFNKMTWVSDRKLWNKEDYWATPIESVTRYAGDCDDFSIAKYFTLLALDIPVDRLRINYVSLPNQQKHMVLSYHPINDKPLILDNINKLLLNKQQRTDLTFIYSFNSKNLWLSNNNKIVLDRNHVIDKWSDMMNRIEKEQG